jgi:methionyl-tRNA synthetase
MAKFYLTTPIFYPNAKLHMGHAFVTTISDIVARYHRLKGDKTYFLTGSDENTQKMVDAALKAGEEPLVFMGGIVSKFKALFDGLEISYDQFIRTTDQKLHWRGAQKLWQRLVDAGDIYKKKYEGLYCVGHEAFITEKDLVDGKCPDHGTVPEFLSEENYFFRLSRYSDEIQKRIETDEFKIVPAARKNEILSFIKAGLEDISFSRPRRADWPAGLGVPVPGDDTQIMYVWCDALANYMTALGYADNADLYKKFWPADLHVIGKDILRFHAAIWPGMLLSAGIPLPKALLVHGFITSGGTKMSKTLGNVIDPEVLITKYGTEAVRYFLARHISPFEDGDMTMASFHEAYNGNLANGLGNLVARVMKLAEDNLDAPITPPPVAIPPEWKAALDSFEFNRAMDITWDKIQKLDQRIQAEEPFRLIKSDPEKGKVMIASLVADLYHITRLLHPVMPQTHEKIKAAILANKKPNNLFKRVD